ncbi:MAG: SDR family oxidoreductase [Gammaproteobacteria bacterium]|nr:SDR family oxidoreductase [Gammaproteobacteria bacterium]
MTHEQKIAIITGASRGIGKAVAAGLAQDGYRVCLLSRSKDTLQHIANEIIENAQLPAHLEPQIYECDVTNIALVNQTIDHIITQLGHVDVLFNNAGILHDGTLENAKDFNDMLNVNLIGAFNILQAVVPHMKKRQQGYVFNLASLCGKIGYAGIGAYTATKFGLVGLSESLFHELVSFNVKVTAICPSYVATEMVSHVEYPSQNLMIKPQDILQIVRGLLLLSPQACVKEIVVYCRATLTDQ